MRGKVKISSSTLRSAAVSVLVILFFLAVIIFYYVMLTSETRQRLIKSSELVAVTAAQEINAYLSNGVYAMKMACHALDNLIRNGSTQEEIRDLLISQSAVVESITSGNTEGLYGFFNGEYLDSGKWVPEAGFDPTERPWYIDARANSGQVAVVEPYLDVRTKTVMLSFSKMLCDAKSVAAMDFSLTRLQVITEELAAQNESDMQIVLDRKYNVIAHSDKSELGKNYITAGDSVFGKALVDALRSQNERQYSFNFGGSDYIVYTVPVAEDWLCLSVFDATSVFRRLRNLLAFTIVTLILVVSVLSVIIGYSSMKSRLAREMKQEAKRAEAASEAKSSFLSSMSHEIRTPINAVLGMNEMILRESGEKNIIEYAENIHTAGNTLLGIVNDILDFSKIEAGKMEIIPVDYDISSLINDLVNMIQKRAENKGLLLKLDFDETMPKLLNGDEIRIKQVVTNILTNAVKYTRKGSVTFRIVHERIPDDPEGVFLNFSVIDTGIGIKPEDMKKLFSEFERIEEKRNRNIEGTGLGMNITKRLLEMMGTSLKVESVYGKGSTFSFRLKQKVVSWEALGDYEAAYRASLSERKKYREKFTAPNASVLVVDDTPMNLTVFRSLLKTTNVQIDTAESGEESLKLMRRKKYDIVFLDHLMPEMDGIETLHKLRNGIGGPNVHTPAICLTANAISGAKERYLAEGFEDYLSKPIEGAALEAAMIKYLPPEKVIIQEETEEETSAPDEMTPLKSFYAGVAELNYDDAIRFCANEEGLKGTLEQFYRSVKQNADAIETFLKEKDYKNYTVKVHALKSSARLIGAGALSADAKHLEDLGNSLTDEDIEHIEELTPKLLADYRKYLDILSPLYAAEEAAREAAPEISADELNEAYEAIRQFIDSFDIDAIDGFISEIRKYRVPKSEEAKFAAVEERIRNMDWHGLEKALKG